MSHSWTRATQVISHTCKYLIRFIQLSIIFSSFEPYKHWLRCRTSFLCSPSWCCGCFTLCFVLSRLPTSAWTTPLHRHYLQSLTRSSKHTKWMEIFTWVLTYSWFHKPEHLNSTLRFSNVYRFPWAETVETKEALQRNPKKTLGFLLTPDIVISCASEKGTCLGTSPAIRTSRRANI